MLSLVIPALNEQDAIAEVIRRANETFADAGISPYEIIVVDDGSADETGERAKAAGAVVVRHLERGGYGRAMKDGIRTARYPTIAIVDGDGTYPIERIPDLLAEHRRGYHMVVGMRTGEYYRESWIKMPLRKLLRMLVEFATGTRIPDANSGLRVFAKEEVTLYLNQLSDTFSFTTSVTLAYLLTGKYVKYVPISYDKRVGRSKVSLVRDSLRTMQYIVEAILYYNPIKIFLVICLFSFGFSVLCLLIALIAGSKTGLIIGAMGLLLTLLIFALGLIADLLRLQHKANRA